jgi:PAS domain S-box-containing protein
MEASSAGGFPAALDGAIPADELRSQPNGAMDRRSPVGSPTVLHIRRPLATPTRLLPGLERAGEEEVAMGTREPERLLAQQSFILDHLPFLVWIMDGPDTFGRVNARVARFLGKPRAEIEGRAIDELLPPAEAAHARDVARQVLRTGEAVTEREWRTGVDGMRLLAITRMPHGPAGATPGRLVCCAQDVTEQHAAEVQRAQSEQNFRNFIEALDDIVLIGDTTGRIVYANPAACRKLEYTADQFRGLTIVDMHPPHLRDEAQDVLAGMITGDRDICPLPLQTRGGRLVPVETRVQFGEWNGAPCIFGLSKDLSVEQELLQKFEKLFRINPALMAITDGDEHRYTDVNDAFLTTLGFTRDEVIGKTPTELGLVSDHERHACAVGQLTETGSLRDVEMTIRTRDGDHRQGLFAGESIEIQGRRYALTVMIDITERNRIAAEREQVIAELQAAIEQIKTLRGIVPICSRCKKIRDDRGYWEQVEAYVTRHTAAEFSHGICPGCLDELYPEYRPPQE